MSEVDTQAIADTIETTPGWTEMQKKYQTNERRGPNKYFGAHAWIKKDLKRWEELDQAGLITPNLKVLDIGSGFGYFAIVGMAYTGSNCIELADVPDPVYDAVTSVLGLSKYEVDVRAFTLIQIQNNDKRYDLITCYRIVFDKWNGFWEEEEYRFFLHDLQSLLNKGGSIVLGFNDRRENKFMKWAAPLGAQWINNHDVLIPYEVLK